MLKTTIARSASAR